MIKPLATLLPTNLDDEVSDLSLVFTCLGVGDLLRELLELLERLSTGAL